MGLSIPTLGAAQKYTDNKYIDFVAPVEYNPAIQPDCDITGRPVVSDPSSLIAMIPNDNIGGGNYKHVFAMLAAKSKYASVGSGTLYGVACEIGYYPKNVNFYDRNYPSEMSAESYFRMVNEKPTGILEFNHKRISSEVTKVVDGLAFTWDEVLYIICNIYNIDLIQLGLQFITKDWVNPDIENFTASYELVESQGTIYIQDNTSGLCAAMACTGMDKYEVNSTGVDVNLPLNTENTSVTNSAAYCGMGKSSITPPDQVVFCISFGKTKTTVQNAVISGVTNWATALSEAESYWENFYSQTEVESLNIPKTMKQKIYLALQQINSMRYGNFITAGIPNWQDNYLRDTGFTVYGISQVAPTMAKDLLSWFSGCTTLTNQNQFDMDYVPGNVFSNTDNGAFFLMAAGNVWKYNPDLEVFTALKPRLDELLAYATTNYNDTDKHILCTHPHDDLDDYQPSGMITVEDVKYESLIDVLWIHALELMAPVYQALEDTTRYQNCVDIASGLRTGLEDFRRTDGGLEYAIKTDGSLYTEVIQSRSNIYAALLLDDDDCKKWLKRPDICAKLTPMGSGIHWAIIPYNSVTGDAPLQQIWHEHFLLTCAIAAKAGDTKLLEIALSSFPFGGWPDYVYRGDVYNWNLKYYSHSWSFSWAAGCVVYAITSLTSLD